MTRIMDNHLAHHENASQIIKLSSRFPMGTYGASELFDRHTKFNGWKDFKNMARNILE